jgi:hypothetical protein
MSSSPEVATAREEVARARGHIADTLAELDARVVGQVDAVKSRLDVVELVRRHPWSSLGIALGAGVAVAVSQADAKAASLAATKAKHAAKQASATTLEIARRTPSRTSDAARAARGGVASYVDGLAARLATSLIDALRERPTGSTTRPG